MMIIIVKRVRELKILSVVPDSKLTFESHMRSVAASAFCQIGIFRKTRGVFRDNSIVSLFIWSFALPVLQYCSLSFSSLFYDSYLSIILSEKNFVGWRWRGGLWTCCLRPLLTLFQSIVISGSFSR